MKETARQAGALKNLAIAMLLLPTDFTRPSTSSCQCGPERNMPKYFRLIEDSSQGPDESAYRTLRSTIRRHCIASNSLQDLPSLRVDAE